MSKSTENKISTEYDMNNLSSRLMRHLQENSLIEPISRKFAALPTNSERVTFVYGLAEEYDLFPQFVVDGKNNEKATKFREEGNLNFRNKKNREAFQCYTKSIAWSELGSEVIGLAYANRSAVLFECKMYEECLTDIQLALENNYPEKFKEKLHLRKEKAENSKTIKPSYFQPMPSLPDSNKSSQIQCSTDSIQIKYNDEIGRHVVAKKDIKIGEILAIEKPFCSILIEQHYNHCWECLELCYNLIPCDCCTEALYCGNTCKQKAFQAYHKFECPILATVKKLELDKLKLLPMKIAIIIREEYENIKNYVSNNRLVGEEERYYYRSDRYEELHNLVGNTEKRSVSDLFERTLTCSVILYLVKNYTQFLENYSEEIFKELLLWHAQTGPCNFHEISELVENKNGIYEESEIGAGAFNFLSMINHSCFPNIVRHCYGSTIVLRAIRSIKAGEQCYDNYGQHHALHDKSERQKKLKKQYFFDCNCEPCTKNWPIYTELPDMNVGLCVSSENLGKLEKAEVSSVAHIESGIIKKMEELEEFIPCKPFSELQEMLKQCYAIYGNVRRW